VASVSFRTRSVPSDLNTDLGLELLDVSSPTGDSIRSGNAVRSGIARILVRHVIGDNNANNRLDVGDATIMQRLLTGLEQERSWDVTGNDVNANTSLDSGDVIKVLRVVANIDPQPTPSASSGLGRLAKAGLGKAGPTGASSELAVLNADRLRAQPGDLVTVQVVLQDVATSIAGASFTLDYPTNALRLLNAQSQHTGSLVPASAVSVWNVQPAQSDYTAQNGRVSFAAASPGSWPSNNGALAEFVFQVQPGQTAQYRWPIHLNGLELTPDGYDVRDLADSDLYFIGRDPLPPHLGASASGVASDGFHLSLSGESGVPYSIEVSTDLVNWASLTTLTAADGKLDFTDAGAKDAGHRFYRARQQ